MKKFYVFKIKKIIFEILFHIFFRLENELF